jgi:AraC-like DNA-binding protein
VSDSVIPSLPELCYASRVPADLPDDGAQRTVMAALVQFFVSFGVKHGLDADELCERAGFHPEQIAYSERHVPYAWLWSVRQAIIERLPDVAVGVEIGRFSSLDQFGYVGHALKYAGSPLATLRWFVICAPLVDSFAREVPPRLFVDADRVRLEVPVQPLDAPECVEGIFTGLVAALRQMTDGRVAIVSVELSRPRPRFTSAFEAFFGCPVEPAAVDAIVFERSCLERTDRASDPNIGRRFYGELERRLQAAGDPFASAVQSGIEALIGSQTFSQETLAKVLGMSARSLQRRLRERELSYQQLLTEVRKGAAQRLLAQPARNIAEVASALGYDLSAFNRAFRSWTGMSPSEYRKTRVATRA